MSFQEPKSDIAICNKALSRIAQQELSGSLNDPANGSKLAGRECRRWYKSTVRQLLQRHHFGLATKRVALVEKVNDRSAEWVAAYVPPSDMAFPVTISAYGTATSTAVGYYQGVGYLLGTLYGRPLFRYEGGTLFSQLSNASVDYVSYDITEQDFTDVFEHLVVIFLASALAASVAKDHQLAKDLKNEGSTEMNQVIAASLNQNPQRYGEFVSQAELARGSAIVDDALMGWRY